MLSIYCRRPTDRFDNRGSSMESSEYLNTCKPLFVLIKRGPQCSGEGARGNSGRTSRFIFGFPYNSNSELNYSGTSFVGLKQVLNARWKHKEYIWTVNNVYFIYIFYSYIFFHDKILQCTFVITLILAQRFRLTPGSGL